MIREGAAPRTRLTPTSFVLLAVLLVLGASAAALLVVDRAGEAIISER